MNTMKFVRFILNKTKAVEPFHCKLLDENDMKVREKIVKDDNQGRSKEHEPFGG